MKQMRIIAALMLGLALGGSIIAWQFRDSFAGGLVFAACEAALVGALADWFAVVALFRHPLGLKFIPHTAIIPNNRGRIIEGIVAIVEKDWLSLDFIRSKVMDYPLIDGIASNLDTEAGRQSLERLAQAIINNVIQNIEPDEAARFIHGLLADNMGQITVSPRFVERMEASIKNLYGEDLICWLINWTIAAARGEEFQRGITRILKRSAAEYSNQGNFMRRLGKGLGESLDIFNYDEAAATLANRINHFLVEMKDPSNQYHIRIKTEMDNLKIADPDSAAVILSGMLKKNVGTEAGLKATSALLASLKMQLVDESRNKSPLIGYMTAMALKEINIVRQDEARKAALENWIKAELTALLERYHGVIGLIVREKLQSLNDAGLVQSLEDKVGDDLQWIRINGTVIGALVGVLQYLILHLL